MKLVATLIASAFAVTAFAQAPAKKEEKKADAKPAVTALVLLHPAHLLPKPTPKVTPKPLPLKRTTKSLLTQLQLRNDLDGGGEDFANDIDIYVGFRRPELVKNGIVDLDNDLSDHVKFRLFLARQLALKKYQEVWGET